MFLMDIKEVKRLRVFMDLSAEELDNLYPLLRTVRVIEGEEFIKWGDEAYSLFIILQGHFMIHFKDGRAITVHEKGSILGWSAIKTPFRYTGHVTALTEGSLLCIHGTKFLELFQANAVLGEKLLKKINEIISERYKGKTI